MSQSITKLDNILRQVEECGLLIYAPPAYGKTEFITNHRHQDFYDFMDTDNLDAPEGSYIEALVTNYHQLLTETQYSLALVFLPTRQTFRSGCEFRELPYKDEWYDDILESIHNACADDKNILTITSEAPILYYDRFICKCIESINEGEEIPPLPKPPVKPVIRKTTTKLLPSCEDLYNSIEQPIASVILPGPNTQYKMELEITPPVVLEERASFKEDAPPTTSVVEEEPTPATEPRHHLRKRAVEAAFPKTRKKKKSSRKPAQTPSTKTLSRRVNYSKLKEAVKLLLTSRQKFNSELMSRRETSFHKAVFENEDYDVVLCGRLIYVDTGQSSGGSAYLSFALAMKVGFIMD